MIVVQKRLFVAQYLSDVVQIVQVMQIAVEQSGSAKRMMLILKVSALIVEIQMTATNLNLKYVVKACVENQYVLISVMR